LIYSNITKNHRVSYLVAEPNFQSSSLLDEYVLQPSLITPPGLPPFSPCESFLAPG
jgi:hypothetical protein